MNGLWGTLLPLIAGGALVPIQLIITILLLRSTGGLRTAAAFVAGMTSVRLAQGLVFGLLLAGGETGGTASGPGPVVSGVLIALAMLLYAASAKQILTDDDPDAPPPKWITMTESMKPGRAFVVGAGLLAIGAKFWVFTLGAIGAIKDADLSRSRGVVTFVAFAGLTVVAHLLVLGVAAVAPKQSAALLDATADWLKRHNGPIVVVLGLVFGSWFLLKGLHGLGVL
jgi:hypothetical protein